MTKASKVRYNALLSGSFQPLPATSPNTSEETISSISSSVDFDNDDSEDSSDSDPAASSSSGLGDVDFSGDYEASVGDDEGPSVASGSARLDRQAHGRAASGPVDAGASLQKPGTLARAAASDLWGAPATRDPDEISGAGDSADADADADFNVDGDDLRRGATRDSVEQPPPVRPAASDGITEDATRSGGGMAGDAFSAGPVADSSSATQTDGGGGSGVGAALDGAADGAAGNAAPSPPAAPVVPAAQPAVDTSAPGGGDAIAPTAKPSGADDGGHPGVSAEARAVFDLDGLQTIFPAERVIDRNVLYLQSQAAVGRLSAEGVKDPRVPGINTTSTGSVVIVRPHNVMGLETISAGCASVLKDRQLMATLASVKTNVQEVIRLKDGASVDALRASLTQLLKSDRHKCDGALDEVARKALQILVDWSAANDALADAASKRYRHKKAIEKLENQIADLKSQTKAVDEAASSAKRRDLEVADGSRRAIGAILPELYGRVYRILSWSAAVNGATS